MSGFAIVLILISAFIHVSWNLISKRTSPTAAFFLTANSIGAWIFFPWVILHSGLVLSLPASVWTLLALLASEKILPFLLQQALEIFKINIGSQ